MNPSVKAVIGEADLHSPTERAVLDRETSTEPTAPHDEADMGNPEESKEIQLANEILAACKSGDKKTVCRAAKELIQMHGQSGGDVSGSHVQPVPPPKRPRALDWAPNPKHFGSSMS